MKMAITCILSLICLVFIYTVFSYAQTDVQVAQEDSQDMDFRLLVKQREKLKSEMVKIEIELSQLRLVIPKQEDENRALLDQISEGERQIGSSKAFLLNIEKSIKRSEEKNSKHKTTLSYNQKMIDAYEKKIEDLRKDEKGEFAGNEDKKNESIENFQKALDEAKSKIKIVEQDMANENLRVAELQKQKKEFEDKIKDLDRKVASSKADQMRMSADIDEQKDKIERLLIRDQGISKEIINVESDIARELHPINKDKEFKSTVSMVFASLVGIVIVGFFIIAANDSHVRTTIFSGQAGIQFLTLFSIVIAIILFGITGILESRELAALLGGLSGYILGRTSTTDASNREASAAETEATDRTQSAASQESGTSDTRSQRNRAEGESPAS